MKVVGICGSPRKNQSTAYALGRALQAASDVSDKIETQLIELAGLDIRGCIGCNRCMEELVCCLRDDFGRVLEALADDALGGLIVATPVYVGGMTSQCRAVLDRSVMLRRNGFRLRDVVGGALVTGGSRNGGQELVAQSIHAVFGIHDMVIVSDGQPTGHFGALLYTAGPGGVEADETGLATAVNLGRRVAEVTLKMRRGG